MLFFGFLQFLCYQLMRSKYSCLLVLEPAPKALYTLKMVFARLRLESSMFLRDFLILALVDSNSLYRGTALVNSEKLVINFDLIHFWSWKWCQVLKPSCSRCFYSSCGTNLPTVAGLDGLSARGQGLWRSRGSWPCYRCWIECCLWVFIVVLRWLVAFGWPRLRD